MSFEGEEQRRSRRVPLSVRLFVLSLDPALIFADHCQTTVVNSHGCAIQAPREFELGTRLCLGNLPGSQVITAHVVHSAVLDPDHKRYSYEKHSVRRYRIGLELDQPGNVWSVESPPSDWSQ